MAFKKLDVKKQKNLRARFEPGVKGLESLKFHGLKVEKHFINYLKIKMW